MRTRYSRRTTSFCGELPPHSCDLSRGNQRRALTRGAVMGRLLKAYSQKVERLTIVVDDSTYQVPAATLSAAIVREHLGIGLV